MTTPYLNRIACVTPPHDVHEVFVRFARRSLRDNRRRALFERMVERSGIAHRWSCLAPAADNEVLCDFYPEGHFPGTAERMARFAAEAPALAQEAVAQLGPDAGLSGITHLIVVSCTGLSAPGIDLHLANRFGLDPAVERTQVGFMGCHGALTGLKLARHIVRSAPDARVLLVSVELCTLHLQEADALDRLLSFLLFGDGCAAALVSARPEGLAIDGFHAVLTPAAGDLITWNIGDEGFEMYLSGRVPGALRDGLRPGAEPVLAIGAASDIAHWAVHPGGRSILDAVEVALELGSDALNRSREVLRRFGNMSSASVLFVLNAVMAEAAPRERGCAMAFGPGLSIESMAFRTAG